MIHYISASGPGDAWVVNELEIIDRSGIPFRLHALRTPASTFHSSQWGKKLQSVTSAIYPLGLQDCVAILLAPFRYRGRFFGALWNALTGERESLRNRIVCFLHLFIAAAWVTRIRKSGTPVMHIHSQWIHSPGSVGFYGAWLLGVSFSFTGHAADIYRERVALRDKIRRAKFINCISTYHQQFFLEHGARPEQLRLVYCGIDVTRFSPAPLPLRSQGLKIRSSGRLVEKKGFSVLIRACGILRDRKIPFECIIGGSGPLESELRKEVESLGLSSQVSITGKAIKQEEIPAFAQSGNVYCLACVWAKDNDVDGLPQMLMEAMACGLPSISTRLVGIPDLVIDGETGLLVSPESAEELADAIVRLQDDSLATKLALAGRKHVLDKFEIERALIPLINEYRLLLKS
ncbi:MAG: glycosyltransferase family 4 protein [Planctomyces sp.]|nr:glycosyltransferase family 4 protein [Planctomyces sp.]